MSDEKPEEETEDTLTIVLEVRRGSEVVEKVQFDTPATVETVEGAHESVADLIRRVVLKEKLEK